VLIIDIVRVILQQYYKHQLLEAIVIGEERESKQNK
jgi:hypothetical protein